MKSLDASMLDCLAALEDAGSFARAAQQLSITQSAVSQRLRTLEAEIGQRLVVRARPLRFTEPGRVLLRYARQMQAWRADLSRELGAPLARDERLPIAVNADSLATWVLAALDDVVHAGQREGFGLELIVDDQDFTHEWLREGAVLGCVSTVSEPLRGCSVQPLGVMRYVAVASPDFVRHWLPQGLTPTSFTQLPFIVFNRKDDMQAQWVERAFGVRAPRLKERYVPSSEAGTRAAAMGWGVAVIPELLAAPHVEANALQVLLPEVALDVSLYWHHWTLHAAEAGNAASGAMARIGRALSEGARRSLRPVAGSRENPRLAPGGANESP